MAGHGHLHQVRFRIIILGVGCLFFAGLIAWKFYTLQISRHDELLEKARQHYMYRKMIKRKRGCIYDAEGNLLAGNLPRKAVICSPYSIVHEPFVHLEKSLKPGVRESVPARREKRRRDVARILAGHFNGSESEFYEMLSPFVPRRDSRKRPLLDENGKVQMRKNQFVRLAPRYENRIEVESAASDRQVLEFCNALKANKISGAGFAFEEMYVRFYPKGRMLASVLGYANVGVESTEELGGLERRLSKHLQPVDRVIMYERSRSGKLLGYGESTVVENGRDGMDVYLTIHETIQAVLEEELDAAQKEFDVDAIYAVIADPRTGNILAVSQRPNFDLSNPGKLNNEMLSFKCAVNAYEPGSVMKPFTVGKALDWGIISPDTMIDCGTSNVWFYAGRPLKDFRGYGLMTPGGVLKKSSNIGTAKIALMMGEDRVARMMRTFKFGVRTNLPFAQETRGVVPKLPFPDKLTITRAPIGYSVQTSILQLTRAYCALANGGFMPELRIIDRRWDPVNNRMLKEPYFSPVQTFENPRMVKELVEMLISVTGREGTARQAAIPGYEVAGKTGTSQKLSRDPVTGRMRYGSEYCASFAGFVPARNPRFVMVVTFDRVRGAKHGGGNVAAPVFGRTMSRILQMMNVPPDFPDKLPK